MRVRELPNFERGGVVPPPELVSMEITMTPEAKVKKVVTKQLKELGAYYFYPATGGYGKSGVPDIVGCYNGFFFGFECKAGKNTATPLQEKNLAEIKAADGLSLIVNEENMHSVFINLSRWSLSKQ
tara:strand:+ start:229 stop:606 length:378 start_codon:yes stop_codon:yes gene_type:complete